MTPTERQPEKETAVTRPYVTPDHTSYLYRLRIHGPDPIPADTMHEILAASDDGDTLETAIQCWLGIALTAAENVVNDALPDGWYCKIEEA